MITDKENTIEANTTFDVAELQLSVLHVLQFLLLSQKFLLLVHPNSVISSLSSAKKKNYYNLTFSHVFIKTIFKEK